MDYKKCGKSRLPDFRRFHFRCRLRNRPHRFGKQQALKSQYLPYAVANRLLTMVITCAVPLTADKITLVEDFGEGPYFYIASRREADRVIFFETFDCNS